MRGAAKTLLLLIFFHASFLLTRLMRGAAKGYLEFGETVEDFYSRASCEARLSKALRASYEITISTHAPHARRGFASTSYRSFENNFYSRASCEARP